MVANETRKQEIIATVSLQEQINVLREKLSAVIARLDEAGRAQDIFISSLDRRLDTMNEFRAAISDQAASFLTRSENIPQMESIIANLRRVEHALGETSTRVEVSSLQRIVYMGLGGVGCFGALVQIMLFLLNRHS